MASLTGRVLDTAGRPVAGAAIFVAEAPVAMPDIARLSDADGGFDLELPVPGRYTIAAAGASGEAKLELEIGSEAAGPVTLGLRPPAAG